MNPSTVTTTADKMVDFAHLQQLWTELQLLYAARPVLVASIAVFVLVHALAWSRTMWKAGYSPVLGFLAIVPPCAVVFPFLLAFVRSPADRELATLRGIERLMRQSETRAFRRAS